MDALHYSASLCLLASLRGYQSTQAVQVNTTTVAVDLVKSVFQLAVADAAWRVTEQRRVTRSQFERWFINRDVSLVLWVRAF